MALQGIGTFTKPHSGNSVGENVTIIRNTNNNFNPNYLSVVNLSARDIDTKNITAKNANIDSADIQYIMSPDGQILRLLGDSIDYKRGSINEITSDSIVTTKLNVKDEANINSLISNYISSNNIVTDYLTVNKSAHFFELIIDKIRSVQGTQINTAANCVVDLVQAFTSTGQHVPVNNSNVAYYRIYWRCTDDDGREITNDWLPLDQALCESFNVNTGASYDVGNKYYWRKVIRTDGGNKRYVNFDKQLVSQTEPDFYIIFPDRFAYGVADESDNYTDFIISSNIEGEWDDTNNKFTPSTTLYGIQLTKNPNNDRRLTGGNIIFNTSNITKLNVGVYYDDDTFEYFPSSEYKTIYNIVTSETKNVQAIVINTAVIDKWDRCNWIDLSNTDKDATATGKSDIPSVGDNVCQLGYRYNELQSPAQDDINRASAIIIAAYNTPDSGIVPPSYAQYQNITDYSLSSHRKSYFDATGCYIVGNFAVQAAGSTTPLEDYIKSFNNANPLEGFISTNNNQNVDLIVLQTDNSNKIYDLNNFPNNLQVMVNYEGMPQMSISDYDVLTLTLFGVPYNLLDANNYTPNLPSGYQGIYVSNITKSQYQPFRLTLAFTGNEQVITTSSMILHAEITNNGTTYQLNKNISINSVSSVKGTDAELNMLNVIKEEAKVDENQTLTTELIYNLKYVNGTTVSYPIADSNKTLTVTTYYNDSTTSTTNVSWDQTNNYWKYTETVANYFTINSKPIYYKIELKDNNNVIDTQLVNVNLTASSLFSVKQGLTQSIQAETSARNTQYSAINQRVNGIDTTVQSQTTQINNINGDITTINTNISNINQRADSISASVTTVQTDLNTLEETINNTGIFITPGKITLDADNTIIDGDLDVTGRFVGTFTSENDTTKMKTVIDTDNGGIKLYGPTSDSINAQQKLITDIGFGTDPDSAAKYGYIQLKDAAHQDYYTLIDDQSLYITDPYNTVNISSGGISWNDSQNNSGGLEMAQLLFRRLRVARPNTNWYDAKMTDDMITSDYDAAMSINLPDPLTSDGKFYFIKHKKDKNTNIRCTAAENRGDSVIMNDDSESVDWQRNVQNNSTLVFCDGIHWILMELDY